MTWWTNNFLSDDVYLIDYSEEKEKKNRGKVLSNKVEYLICKKKILNERRKSINTRQRRKIQLIY
jgi:hypothetical protein